MSQSNKVWSKFSSKVPNGEIIKLRIVDMPEGRLKDVEDLMQQYFVPEETTFKTAGVNASIEAMKESEEVWKTLFDARPHHITVCCIDDGTEDVTDIIGASITVIAIKDDIKEDLQFKTNEMKKWFDIISGLVAKFDTLKTFGLDRMCDDRGVVVHSKYRRLGIAREFFKVRRMYCKENGLPITGAWMTAIGSQKAAEQDGWDTVYEESYDDLGKQFGVTFKSSAPTCKYMIGRPE